MEKLRKRFKKFLRTGRGNENSNPQVNREFKFNHAPKPILVKEGSTVKGDGITREPIKIAGAIFKEGSHQIIAQRVICDQQQYQIQHPWRKDLAIWLRDDEFIEISIKQ